MNRYPTPEHQDAAEAIVEFFATTPEIEAVCLICSCARGKASRDSCLDILVLGRPEPMSIAQEKIQKSWDKFYTTDPVFQKLAAVGKYAHVDLEFSDGHFAPTEHYWVGGPDEFELIIGNYLVYSVPLHQKSNYLDELKAHWFPYYDEALRHDRLQMVRKYCLNNLDHMSVDFTFSVLTAFTMPSASSYKHFSSLGAPTLSLMTNGFKNRLWKF